MQFYCPRATKPLCSSGFPVHDLPSQDSRPNGGYCPAAQSRFGRFLALTVPSAVGLVTHVPLRLYPDEKSSLQRTATRRHRTQLYEILGSFELFFRKVTYFAKKRGTPCAARHSRFMPEKSRKLELVVDTEKRLVYTVIRLKLESFRKVCYFAKIFALTICFLSHIICIEKKKTAKTPSREIERAKRYRADYESKEV